MHQFSTTTGMERLPITVDYDILSSGNVHVTNAWVSLKDGPYDILGYLSATQYHTLNYEAAMDYRRITVDRVEKEILANIG